MEINRSLSMSIQTGRVFSAEGASMLTFNRILVAVDGSPTSNKVLAAAVELARSHGGRIRLVHSVDELQYMSGFDPSAEVRLPALTRSGREQFGM
jgi:hypothetical protein